MLHRPLFTRVSPVAQLHLDPTWLQWWACSTRSSRTTQCWRLVSVRLWSSWRQHRSSLSPSRRPVGPGTRRSSFKLQCLVFSHVTEACSHFYFPWQKRKAVSFSGKRVKLLLDCDVNGDYLTFSFFKQSGAWRKMRHLLNRCFILWWFDALKLWEKLTICILYIHAAGFIATVVCNVVSHSRIWHFNVNGI